MTTMQILCEGPCYGQGGPVLWCMSSGSQVCNHCGIEKMDLCEYKVSDNNLPQQHIQPIVDAMRMYVSNSP